MKKNECLQKKNNRQAYLVAGVFLTLLSIAVSFVCIGYYNWLQATIRADSGGYLQEISKKTGSNVQKIVSDHFSMLSTMETLMQNLTINSVDEMQQIVETQRQNWNYNDLLLIDETGAAFDDSGRRVMLTDGNYLPETVVNRQRAISPAQVINGEDCILFAIPAENIFIGDTEIRALGATYRLDTFDQVLSTTAFDGQAYTHIINRDGAIIVPSAAPSAVGFGYNAITYLQSAAPERAAALEAMRADIRAGKSGQVDCRFNDQNHFVTYHPVDTLDWYLLTVVPVSVANAKTQGLLAITLLFCLFTILLVTALVLMLTFSFFRNKRQLEQLAFVDPITGGNTLQYFTLLVGDILKKTEVRPRALIYSNLEKFRIINEQFDREAGDMILKSINQVVSADLCDGECFCRITDDHFCILVEYDDQEQLLSRLRSWYMQVTAVLSAQVTGLECPISQFGVYVINDRNVPLNTMVDRARFAINKLEKGTEGRLRYAVYDEKAHQRILREKHLEDRMERALEENEFQIYLQPKYLADIERIGGAEALVRWISKDEGMIYPDDFIPLFEKNGFIIPLDLFVFEQVCKLIRSWIDAGLEPTRISVNCSRIHFNKADFLDAYQQIFLKYDIPAEYVELELTESVVYENMERLSEVIDQIHEIGFTCSIDDFGSGYSSLNIIKDISADVLKLDKIFFRSTNSNDARGRSVVESILSLAKSLSMQTVAEGVEYRTQVDMLKQMNCDYIQGYVFARPMPVDEFQKLVYGLPDKVASP